MASSKHQNNSQTTGATSARSWKGKVSLEGFDLDLPSGNTCRIKPMTIPELISRGLLADSLSVIADEHVNKGQGKAPKDFQKKKKSGNPAKDKDGISTKDAVSAIQDPEKMSQLFDSIDKVIPAIVVEPTVLYHRIEVEENGLATMQTIPVEDRDEDILYTDQVDFQDKMFIFNYVVGGTSDLEDFRESAGESLDGLQSGK